MPAHRRFADAASVTRDDIALRPENDGGGPRQRRAFMLMRRVIAMYTTRAALCRR